MTIHSTEGVLVVTIIGILSVCLCVFYIRWRYAVERLKTYHHLEESKSKVRNMNPTADAIPIMYGHIESSLKAIDVRYPITAPAIRLKAIFFRALAISSTVKKRLSERKGDVNQ